MFIRQTKILVQQLINKFWPPAIADQAEPDFETTIQMLEHMHQYWATSIHGRYTGYSVRYKYRQDDSS